MPRWRVTLRMARRMRRVKAVEPAPAQPVASPAAQTVVQGLDEERVGALLSQRDKRIAELERMVAELGRKAEVLENSAPVAGGEGTSSESAAVLEARLEEQEQSLRHVLTMLIEWFEDESREAA